MAQSNESFVRERLYIRDLLIHEITKAYSDYVSKMELALCDANETPIGFTFDGKSFGPGHASSVGISEELRERAEEVWIAKTKLMNDKRKLESYFSRVLARLREWGQMYDVIPEYLHDTFLSCFNTPPRRTPEHLRLIVYMDPEIKKIMDFHVMFRLVG